MTFLTGIKPTGEFHLGNYISTIKQIQNLNITDKVLLFIADYHSLTTHPTNETLTQNILHISAVLKTFFNNNKNIIIYRQSKIPQIFEFYYILNCFCSKGLLNRAHAYKTQTENNKLNNNDLDKNIFMGLYTYPTLMAADILLLSGEKIPIGQDQKQHIEIAKEIANKINYFYDKKILTSPECLIQNESILLGTDGRKMSKSYKNTIGLFEEEKSIRKKIFSIATNSKNIGEPKFENESTITDIFKLISEENEYLNLLNEMKNGIGWGDVKKIVFEKILDITNEIRPLYNEYLNNKNVLFDEIEKDEENVRNIAQIKLNEIKNYIGI